VFHLPLALEQAAWILEMTGWLLFLSSGSRILYADRPQIFSSGSSPSFNKHQCLFLYVSLEAGAYFVILNWRLFCRSRFFLFNWCLFGGQKSVLIQWEGGVQWMARFYAPKGQWCGLTELL